MSDYADAVMHTILSFVGAMILSIVPAVVTMVMFDVFTSIIVYFAFFIVLSIIFVGSRKPNGNT